MDRTAMEKIIWPGPPEKPRITYLWSLAVVSGSERDGTLDLIAGRQDADLSNPKGSTRLLRPYGIFADADLLYITDPGASRVTIVDMKNSTSMNIVGAEGKDFESPIGVVALDEKIYISDSVLKKVFVFGREGNLLGKLEGDFERPTALALDRTRGKIYVADSLAHKVYIYDREGKRTGSIGKHGSGKGEFNFPVHLWVDGSGKLYVTDSLNFRIQVFSPEGRLESMFGALGDAYGDLDKPKGVATDSQGNIYVVDSIKDEVKIFDRAGNLLLLFGQEGQDYGQFWLPSGIFVDNRDTIYVADTYNGRVQAFKYIGGQ
jgi:DNA-binding beta-propeller fold protein YncE